MVFPEVFWSKKLTSKTHRGMALIDLDHPPTWWASEPIQRLTAEDDSKTRVVWGHVGFFPWIFLLVIVKSCPLSWMKLFSCFLCFSFFLCPVPWFFEYPCTSIYVFGRCTLYWIFICVLPISNCLLFKVSSLLSETIWLDPFAACLTHVVSQCLTSGGSCSCQDHWKGEASHHTCRGAVPSV